MNPKMEEAFRNPSFEGCKRCSYCKKYFDENMPHSCYIGPEAPCPAHKRRLRPKPINNPISDK